MIIKPLKNKGKGTAKTALRYLLNKPNGQARVLKGDPDLSRDISDALSYRHKYECWVLSFEESSLPDEVKLEIIDEFEKAFLPYFQSDPTRYNVTWIEHSDKNRVELNLFMPKVDLITEKQISLFNTSKRSDWDLMNNFRDYINHKFKLSNPFDESKAQLVKGLDYLYKAKSSGALSQKEMVSEIDKSIQLLVKSGKINNRNDIITTLEKNGFEIVRVSKSSISIKNPTNRNGQNIKLKGVLFNESFTSVESGCRTIIERASGKYRAEHQGNNEFWENRNKNNFRENDYTSSGDDNGNRNEFSEPYSDFREKLEESIEYRRKMQQRVFEGGSGKGRAFTGYWDNVECHKEGFEFIRTRLEQGKTRDENREREYLFGRENSFREDGSIFGFHKQSNDIALDYGLHLSNGWDFNAYEHIYEVVGNDEFNIREIRPHRRNSKGNADNLQGSIGNLRQRTEQFRVNFGEVGNSRIDYFRHERTARNIAQYLADEEAIYHISTRISEFCKQFDSLSQRVGESYQRYRNIIEQRELERKKLEQKWLMSKDEFINLLKTGREVALYNAFNAPRDKYPLVVDSNRIVYDQYGRAIYKPVYSEDPFMKKMKEFLNEINMAIREQIYQNPERNNVEKALFSKAMLTDWDNENDFVTAPVFNMLRAGGQRSGFCMYGNIDDYVIRNPNEIDNIAKNDKKSVKDYVLGFISKIYSKINTFFENKGDVLSDEQRCLLSLNPEQVYEQFKLNVEQERFRSDARQMFTKFGL